MRFGVPEFVALIPLVGWLAAVFFIVSSSLDPDQYFRYGFEEKTEFVHPTGPVAFVVALTAIEMGSLYIIVRPWAWPLSLVRLGTALALLSGWFALCLQVVMHMPGYMLNHHIWVLALATGTGLALLVVACSRMWGSLSRRAAA